MSKCSRCRKDIGFFSSKHEVEGKLFCHTCFLFYKKELEKKNNKIITEYIEKYLSNRSFEFWFHISELSTLDFANLFDEHSIVRIREYFDDWKNADKYINSDMDAEDIDTVSLRVELGTIMMDFLDDLERIYELLSQKGVESNYKALMSFFYKLAKNKVYKRYDRIIDPAYKTISETVGTKLNKKDVIKQFMKMPLGIEYNIFSIGRLLQKFNIDYNENELKGLIATIDKEKELEEFEKDMELPPRVELGDFHNLTGHEFEEYIKKLLKYDGYSVIKTPGSGDQGADLIATKDSEKTVIQTKKYSEKVTNKAIQEVVASKSYYKANKAMVITNSSFTKSAMELALANNVELWDGQKLKEKIQRLEINRDNKSVKKLINADESEETKKVNVTCPACQKEFECEVTLSPELGTKTEINTTCPNCGLPIKGTITRQE